MHRCGLRRLLLQERANPLMGSWPTAARTSAATPAAANDKYRRLHLNLPGAPDGAFLDVAAIMARTVTGWRRLPQRGTPMSHRRHVAAAPMTGRSRSRIARMTL